MLLQRLAKRPCRRKIILSRDVRPLGRIVRPAYGTEGYWFESSGVYLPVSRRSKPPSFSELWEAFFVWYQRFTLSSPFCGFLPSVSKRFQVRCRCTPYAHQTRQNAHQTLRLAEIGFVAVTLAQVALFTKALQILNLVATTLGSWSNVINVQYSVFRGNTA